MKMVITRGKKKNGSSNKRPEAKEAAENGSAETRSSGWLTVDMEETNEDTQLEDEVDLVTDKEENANSAEMSGVEGEKATDRDNEDPSAPVTKSMFVAYDEEEEAESEENTSEDGEKDDQEDILFENNKEHIDHDGEHIDHDDEYELSEEEASEENDGDEDSGEEATEEDEVSSEEATAEENDEENNQEGEENAKQDAREAKATEDGQETKERDIEKQEASLKDINKKPSEGSIKKKVLAARLKKADSEDKPESSSKRELKKRPSPQSVKAHVEFSSRNGDGFTGEEAREEDAVTEEHNGEKENAKQDTREAKATEYGRETKEHGIEKLESSLKNIEKPSEGSIKKKVQVGKLKKVDSEDKPESSQKRKVKKRLESMGMIFMCNTETKKDCHQYRVFGLPESKKDIVEKIYTGMRLFLYDIDKKLMHGIYKAAGPGGYNIEPKAFKAQYPSQVRFKLMEKCTPLAEEKFKTVIKQNYFTKTKFDCQLNSEQVKKLCRLFNASKGRPLKKMGRSLKSEKHPARQERNIRQRAGDKRRLPLREEVRLHERPRKRSKRVVSPAAAAPRYRIPAPIADPYRRERSPYRERRDQPLTPFDPYGGVREHGRDPPPPRDERYRDGHDPRLEDHYAYRGGRDSRIADRRDPYVDEVDTYSRRRDRYADVPLTYIEPHDPYRAGQDAYLVRRDSYRDRERDRRSPYIESRDPYRDPRSSYLEHRVPYAETAQPVLYSTYRRPALSDNRDAYREDRAVDLRDTYRRDELLSRRELPPLDSGTRTHHELAGRDAYVPIRERPSYVEPLYPSAYPSRAAVYRL